MIDISLESGKYVVAVSGGVDSVALLHLLSELSAHKNGDKRPATSDSNRIRLVVAHFDHGIRSDSGLDRRLVQTLAKKYDLPFVYQQGNLGAGASEDEARQVRYDFLRQVQVAVKADAIITAHHQDDVVETAVINLLRGTGRKGISALRDHPHLRRPLLHVTKDDIRSYASEQGLVWREDSTNANTAITRNYIRKVLLPKLGTTGRRTLLDLINHIKVLNQAIDNDLGVYLHSQPSRQSLDRHAFALLPHSVAREVVASWLRSHGVADFDSVFLEKLVVGFKTLSPGKQIDIDARHRVLVGRESLVFISR